MTLHFNATPEQRRELEGLAYWIADVAYIKEKYGVDDPEISVSRNTIEKSIFPKCDCLSIPKWVQNSVIAWAENWRQYKTEYMDHAMKAKGIIL